MLILKMRRTLGKRGRWRRRAMVLFLAWLACAVVWFGRSKRSHARTPATTTTTAADLSNRRVPETDERSGEGAGAAVGSSTHVTPPRHAITNHAAANNEQPARGVSAATGKHKPQPRLDISSLSGSTKRFAYVGLLCDDGFASSAYAAAGLVTHTTSSLPSFSPTP